ncbi:MULTISPECIES: response regulator [Aeromonas]|uniref:response regulator n=1 Tax=Aeromonas TaxID=642 RepID=UPI001927E035|nr:response regulator [Aeromonas veronii]MCJ8216258.1 response regulator [Aeromonas veronii]MCR3973575.1 response regulator [Aeromonas veronii]MCR3977810.1 response regulator [Aeromonas veronii]HDZ8846992.1 response regulator [Aeromonas veronii]
MKTGLKRILVVDDAATVRMYHKQILQQAGYLVDEAVNGLEALEKALLSPYDLYLVDINMPKLDGYDFLKDLRSRDIFQGPAIMISTEAQQHDKLRAFASGANLYMVKPIKPAELLKYCALLLGLGTTV